MSIDTSQQLNGDQLQANLPAGAAFTAVGGELPSTQEKTITPIGTDDTTLQAAVDQAAADFVDYSENKNT